MHHCDSRRNDGRLPPTLRSWTMKELLARFQLVYVKGDGLMLFSIADLKFNVSDEEDFLGREDLGWRKARQYVC